MEFKGMCEFCGLIVKVKAADETAAITEFEAKHHESTEDCEGMYLVAFRAKA